MNNLKKTTQAQVLRLDDLEKIIHFEKSKLLNRIEDEFERELAGWQASWRKESLEHYLPLGWSFGLFSHTGELLGYFIAQPQLFVRGMMQTLWVERLSANGSEHSSTLIEIAYGLAREKHFQKILFHQEEDAVLPAIHFKTQSPKEQITEINTAKLM